MSGAQTTGTYSLAVRTLRDRKASYVRSEIEKGWTANRKPSLHEQKKKLLHRKSMKIVRKFIPYINDTIYAT